jgi:catechol 2,3-dioxygenase-like lactoylglutathione lyase family enzyme
MDSINVQMTFDCADPHAQTRFWGAALGWEIEDSDEFIRKLMADGLVTDDDVVDMGGGRLGFTTGAAIRRPAGTDGPVRLLFMQVPEGKQAKNRAHLDLNVGPERRDAEVERLVALGATELYRMDEPGAHHVTMQDPEGNEFCVQ